MKQDHADPITILAPISGKTCELDRCNSAIYSHLLLGCGRVIHVTGSKLIAPIQAVVSKIDIAHREIWLTAPRGLTCVLSFAAGDCVYHGEGIEWQVKPGSRVDSGELLAKVHLPQLKKRLDTVMLAVCFPQLNEVNYQPVPNTPSVREGESFLQLYLYVTS